MEAREAERRHRENLRFLKLLRPIDDVFMRCLFRDNLPLTQLVLRIITGRQDLIVTSCQTQKDLKRLAGARSVCLDIWATDSAKKQYDIEVRRWDEGAEPHRARYHASVMDVENLNAGNPFSALPETYVIFLTEFDVYGQGKALYPVERINLATGKPFEDGEHILYVNGAYRDDSELGKLMHDFCCADASEMYYPLMAEGTRYWKESEKGVRTMSKTFTDLWREGQEEAFKEGGKKTMVSIVKKILADGALSPEQIAKYADLTLDEVRRLQSGQSI